MIDWQKIRSDFPAVENSTYLCTAGGGCLSAAAKKEIDRYYDEMHLQGDVCWDAWLARTENVRRRLASMLNAEPYEIAFLTTTSLGMNYAADLFNVEQEVLTLQNEFPSVTLPWLHRGYPVQFLPVQPDGGYDFDTFDLPAERHNRIFATSFVQYATGFRQNLTELGQFCEVHDLALIVDATQGFGVFPIDVKRDKIDMLIFSGYKWAGAGYAIAPMFIRHELLSTTKLPAVGWRSSKMPYALRNNEIDFHHDASALELGHPPFPGIFALGGALQQLEEIGLEQVESRVHELTGMLHQKLDAIGAEIISTRDRAHRSGITMVAVNEPKQVAEALAKRNIHVSARGRGIRVALHFYNNEQDIEIFVGALAELTAAGN